MLSIKKILHPTDFSSCARAAFEHAAYLARQLQAELHVMYALSSVGACTIEEFEADRAHQHASVPSTSRQVAQQMQSLVEATQADDLRIRRFLARCPHLADAVIDHARAEDIDLIALGAFGCGNGRQRHLGSVAQDVMRRAPCPILFVPGPDAESPAAKAIDRILVYINFERSAAPLLPIADELATLYDADLDVLCVVEPSSQQPEEQQVTAELETTYRQRLERLYRSARDATDAAPSLPSHAQFHLRTGYAPDVIARFVQEHDVDLLVMVSPGIAGTEYNRQEATAERVVSDAPCPAVTFDVTAKPLGVPAFAEQEG